MKITETKLKGCFLIEPKIFKDQRGHFFEAFRKDEFENKLGYEINFVQENQSISKKGVLRGLHFQKGIAAQSKLINVIKGEALDVVVDLRPDSPSFGNHLKMKLSRENHFGLFIPKGMAHGFIALTNEVIFNYKCDNYYNPKAEGGIFYMDTELNIDWEYPLHKIIVSEKDMDLPSFKSFQR